MFFFEIIHGVYPFLKPSGCLLQLMMELESAIHREWLSPLYETAEELLEITTNGNNASIADSGTTLPSVLPWIPQTTAAVALRLLIMDAAIYYSHEQKQLKLKMADTKTNELVEMVCNADYLEVILYNFRECFF